MAWDGVGGQSDIDLDRALVKRCGLYEFVKLSWHVIETAAYCDNWHVEEICNHLEAVTRGEITDLIINIPPGCMKSLLVDVFWPVWEWIEHPDTRWLYGSFDASLTRRESLKAKKLLTSPWFQARWGGDVCLADDGRQADSATEWYTNRKGLRFATSVKGKGTGWHVHRRVADDPSKPRDTKGGSEATGVSLQDVIDWWTGTTSTRRASGYAFASVIVMQRLHEDDLTGHCLKSGEYVHLCFPMEFDAAKACRTKWGGDRRTVDGELLWPGRFGPKEIEALKDPVRGLGAIDYAAQCQQSPMPKSGGIFKGAHFKQRFKTLPTEGLQWMQSWDMRFIDSTTRGDMVVGGVWAWRRAEFYLVKVVRGRWSFTETLERLKDLSAEFPQATLKLVEDKANGPAVVSVLKADVPGLVLVNPEGGKIARANAVSPFFEAGNVYLPDPERLATWVDEYIAEMTGFPRAKFDDQVDMTSQALLRLKASMFFTYMDAMKKLKGQQ